MRNLIAALSFVALMGATGQALADVSCPPGTSGPDCTAPTVPETDATLTASFHGAPEKHNGKKLFAFEIRFSEEFDGLRLPALKQALQVTGGRLVDVKRTVRGQNGGVTVRVRPASDADMTVTLAAGGSLANPISLTVPGPALTASFHGAPAEHDGKKLFAFEIRFSEEVVGRLLPALKQALQVTGGRLVDVKRTVRGQNRSVTVRVRPDSSGDVTVTLPATTDCQAAGAICARAGRNLSEQASVSIASATSQPVSSAVAEEGDSESEPETAASTLEDPPVFSDPPTPRSNLISTVNADPSGLPNITATSHSTTVKQVEILTTQSNITTFTWDYDLREVLRNGKLPSTLSRIGGDIAVVTGAEVDINQVINMNRLGHWGHPDYHIGWFTNRGPNLEVRLRQTSSEHEPFKDWVFPPGDPEAGRKYNTKELTVLERWLTYPANPGTNDIRIHVRTKTPTREDAYLVSWALLHGDGSLWDYDWFVAEAHLVAPGTAVQPTAIGGQASATWTGKVVAVNSDKSHFGHRGDLLGGDASLTFTFATNTADVTLNNLRSSRFSGLTFSALTWSGLAVSNGAFSEETASRKISGTFRQQGSDKNANTVGGVFESDVDQMRVRTNGVVATTLKTKLTGGFVATRN